MSNYSWPAAVTVKRTHFFIAPAARTFTSPYSRAVQAVDLMAEVWRAQVDITDDISKVTGGQVEALFDRLKGPVNTISLYHFGRPAPLGTMRGTPTLSASAAQLANTVSISTTTGNTLLAGDMIGIGGQLCRVMADAVSVASVMTVEIAPRLRVAMSSGAAVTWDKPTSTFIMAADSAPVDWMPGYYTAPSVEFVETP